MENSTDRLNTSCFKEKDPLVKLRKMNNTLSKITLGVACGVFISTLPVYGLQTVLMALAAIIIERLNKSWGHTFFYPPIID